MELQFKNDYKTLKQPREELHALSVLLKHNIRGLYNDTDKMITWIHPVCECVCNAAQSERCAMIGPLSF